MKKFAFLMLLMFGYTAVFSQQAQPVEMADAMYSSGRIYVVIVVIAIIFTGLSIYLFSIDRRLRKIEKEK